MSSKFGNESRKRPSSSRRDDKEIKKRFDFSNTQGTRFLIPSKAAGMMIGKGGEVIKNLRSQFPDCRIIVPDSDGPERIVLIDGPIESITSVWDEAIPMLKEIMNAKECDFRNKDGRSTQSEDEIDLRLLAHESIVGSIIGKGGDRIRNLVDKHGMTLIKVSTHMCPRSTDRVIRLVGELPKLLGCLKDILETLSTQVLRGPRTDYNPNYYDESISSSYGGFISKDGRYPVRRVGANDDIGNMRGSSYVDSQRIEENLSSMRNFLMGNSGRRSPQPPPAADLLGGVMQLPGPHDYGIHVSKVAIAPHLVDAILGREGQRLLDIRADSGADIDLNIDRMTEDSIFIIRGSADQIYKAQCLLQLCARKFGEREREREHFYY